MFPIRPSFLFFHDLSNYNVDKKKLTYTISSYITSSNSTFFTLRFINFFHLVLFQFFFSSISFATHLIYFEKINETCSTVNHKTKKEKEFCLFLIHKQKERV